MERLETIAVRYIIVFLRKTQMINIMSNLH